jgi:hypothetical protein
LWTTLWLGQANLMHEVLDARYRAGSMQVRILSRR